MEKVHTYFQQSIVHNILNISLLSKDQPDKLIWDCEKNGMYSVKSAYGMMQLVGEGSNAQLIKDLWKSIWKMQIPLKVEVLAWRACNEGLPIL